MSKKSKLMYLNILLNYKNGVYTQDKEQLRQDLLALRLLLMVDKDNDKMKKVENKMRLMLKKC